MVPRLMRMLASRTRRKTSWQSSIVAICGPAVALLTFPSRFVHENNLVHDWFASFAPLPEWKPLPTGCRGQPLGPPPLVHMEFSLALAEDLFAFALASIVLNLVLCSVTIHRLVAAWPLRTAGDHWSVLLATATVSALACGMALLLRQL
jgi:hypothetical protein